MVALAGIRRRFVVLHLGPPGRRDRYHAVLAAHAAQSGPPLAFRRPTLRIPLRQLMQRA